jgi:hypothetical protein
MRHHIPDHNLMSSAILYVKTLATIRVLGRRLEENFTGEFCGMIQNNMFTPTHIQKRGRSWQEMEKASLCQDSIERRQFAH